MVKYAQQVLLRQDASGVGLEEPALLKALDIVPAEHVSVLALCLIVCFAARRSGVCVVIQMLFLVWLTGENSPAWHPCCNLCSSGCTQRPSPATASTAVVHVYVVLGTISLAQQDEANETTERCDSAIRIPLEGVVSSPLCGRTSIRMGQLQTAFSTEHEHFRQQR